MHFLVHFFVSLLSLLLIFKCQMILRILDLELDVYIWSVHLKGLLEIFQKFLCTCTSLILGVHIFSVENCFNCGIENIWGRKLPLGGFIKKG